MAHLGKVAAQDSEAGTSDDGKPAGRPAADGARTPPKTPEPDWSEKLANLVVAARSRSLIGRLVIVLASVLAAALIRHFFYQAGEPHLSYAPFHLAVVISALTAGVGGALIASLLSIIITHAFFWPLKNAHDAVGLATFVLTALLLAAVIEALWRSKAKLTQAQIARQRDAYLKLLIEQAPVAIAMFDRDMHYLAASDRWIEEYNLIGRDIIGHSHYEIFPNIPDRWKEAHRRGLAGETLGAEEDPYQRLDGTMSWERWEIRPWRTADDQIGGITIVAENETRRVDAERALASSMADLQRAQALGNIGSWRWRMDVTPAEFTASEVACRILGRSPDDRLNYEESLALVHPDDVEMVDAIWRQAMSGTPYDQEFRIIVDDEVRWVHEQAQLEYDRNGNFIGVFGTLQDITEGKNAQATLRASEERLRLALDAAQMGIWDLDLTTGQDNWNDQTFRLIGHEPGSVAPTYATWRQRIHPDDRARIDAEFKKSLEQKSEQHSVYRVILDSGEIRWIEARGRHFTNPAGEAIRSFGVMMDVTEQKRAEERNMLLTAEVNHRAKNLLAVVQAVALQTAREDDPEEFAENFSERLAGLAACHDLLVHSEWWGVDTAALAQSQMQHFANLIGGRVVVDGPPVELNASAAQTLGMAIHELSTNASKHGALSTTEGTIRLSWNIEKGPGESLFVMRWTERDGPQVKEPKRRGFGQKVMVDMVEYSLDARVAMSYSPDGLTWQVKAPLPRVIADGLATA